MTHGDPLHVDTPKPRQPRSDEEVRAVLLDRRKITTSGCWEYTGHRFKDGYGSFRYRRQYTTAHRVSYIVFIGPIPVGKVVRHTCDNPPCINPDHLITGTQLDNVRDAVSRQRMRSVPRLGSANPLAKLTEDDVRHIRRLYGEGARQNALAEQFGISQARVSGIVRRISWAHVD